MSTCSFEHIGIASANWDGGTEFDPDELVKNAALGSLAGLLLSGDVLLLEVQVNKVIAQPAIGPHSWTFLAFSTGEADKRGWIWWRRCNGTETDQTITFTEGAPGTNFFSGGHKFTLHRVTCDPKAVGTHNNDPLSVPTFVVFYPPDIEIDETTEDSATVTANAIALPDLVSKIRWILRFEGTIILDVTDVIPFPGNVDPISHTFDTLEPGDYTVQAQYELGGPWEPQDEWSYLGYEFPFTIEGGGEPPPPPPEENGEVIVDYSCTKITPSLFPESSLALSLVESSETSITYREESKIAISYNPCPSCG